MDVDLLPVVSAEVKGPLIQEVTDDDKQYVKDQIQRINKINPCVAQFISAYSLKTEDVMGSALCGIMVYRLLECQAEAELMKDTFKFDPNE